jgi:hypothetical protein
MQHFPMTEKLVAGRLKEVITAARAGAERTFSLRGDYRSASEAQPLASVTRTVHQMLVQSSHETKTTIGLTLRLDKVAPYQKYNFNANWIWREVRWNVNGAPAERIEAAPGEPTVFAGLLNCGVFVILKNSERNWRRRPRSVEK